MQGSPPRLQWALRRQNRWPPSSPCRRRPRARRPLPGPAGPGGKNPAPGTSGATHSARPSCRPPIAASPWPAIAAAAAGVGGLPPPASRPRLGADRRERHSEPLGAGLGNDDALASTAIAGKPTGKKEIERPHRQSRPSRRPPPPRTPISVKDHESSGVPDNRWSLTGSAESDLLVLQHLERLIARYGNLCHQLLKPAHVVLQTCAVLAPEAPESAEWGRGVQTVGERPLRAEPSGAEPAQPAFRTHQRDARRPARRPGRRSLGRLLVPPLGAAKPRRLSPLRPDPARRPCAGGRGRADPEGLLPARRAAARLEPRAQRRPVRAAALPLRTAGLRLPLSRDR
jgi:hypothetical protein